MNPRARRLRRQRRNHGLGLVSMLAMRLRFQVFLERTLTGGVAAFKADTMFGKGIILDEFAYYTGAKHAFGKAIAVHLFRPEPV